MVQSQALQRKLVRKHVLEAPALRHCQTVNTGAVAIGHRHKHKNATPRIPNVKREHAHP